MTDDEILHDFEDEFNSLSESLQRKLKQLPHYREDESSMKSLLQEAEEEVYDINQCIIKLERSMRHFNFDKKQEAQYTLSQVRSKFNEQKEELTNFREASKGGAARVMTGMNAADQQKWKGQRQRLLGTQKMVDESSMSLGRTAVTLDETTQTGVETTLTLQQQREQLIYAKETIHETDDLLDRSAKTLRRMRRRLVTNKLIQGLIIILELCAIALIIYIKYFS